MQMTDRDVNVFIDLIYFVEKYLLRSPTLLCILYTLFYRYVHKSFSVMCKTTSNYDILYIIIILTKQWDLTLTDFNFENRL